MRKTPWQMWLLMLWPYLAMAANLLLIRIVMMAWFAGLLGTLLVTVLNVCCALHQREASVAVRTGMLTKLVHIPAYALSLLMAPVIWMAPPLVLALLLTNVCMLIATSAYGLRGVYLAWRGGKLSNGWAILLAVSQLIFVLDVPGSILLYIKLRSGEGLVR